MAKKSWIQRILHKDDSSELSYLRSIISGSMYRISDLHTDSSVADIKTQIDTMRALVRDSQISTALSYYATDATTTNTDGQIIWATPTDDVHKEPAEIVNGLLSRWQVNSYARDHILELATIGNLYIPTTDLYRKPGDTQHFSTTQFSLDTNTIPDEDFDIVPSTKVPPETIIHLYKCGVPSGYIVQPDEHVSEYVIYPESSIIHFSLGGLLGDYTIDIATKDTDEPETYDIKFAQPLMDRAVQPTQTLSLLEDANLLSSLIRSVKFINVECGNAEDTEVQDILQRIKDAIEQQLALNTSTGDAQSFVNPQSPNNFIYLPKIKGMDAISITDLNMTEINDADSKLLEHFQDKKLSVLGVPKEAMNFSSNEGLGGAGSVLSQRSALYANSLQRLKTAYMEGWKSAINTYFQATGKSGMCDLYKLHMTEVITTQSTITFDKRDAAMSQASTLIDILKSLGVNDADAYKQGLTEIFTEVLPMTGASVNDLSIDVSEGGGNDEF